MARIQVKPLERRTKNDGYRVLALPYWPKGLAKGKVDCWLKELAPEPKLMSHLGCGLSPEAYAYVYRSALGRPCGQNRLKPLALLSLRRRITFLCACPDRVYCHDRVLAQALEDCRIRSDFRITRWNCAA